MGSVSSSSDISPSGELNSIFDEAKKEAEGKAKLNQMKDFFIISANTFLALIKGHAHYTCTRNVLISIAFKVTS